MMKQNQKLIFPAWVLNWFSNHYLNMVHENRSPGGHVNPKPASRG